MCRCKSCGAQTEDCEDFCPMCDEDMLHGIEQLNVGAQAARTNTDFRPALEVS